MPTKNGRPKSAQFGPGLWELLQLEPCHPEYVFCRAVGKRTAKVIPWKETSLRREWFKLLETCGISNLRIHDLRRSFSSVGQAQGHAASAVQAVGGWEDPSVMQRHYSHANRRQKAAVVEDLEGLLTGNAQVDQQAVQVDLKTLLKMLQAASSSEDGSASILLSNKIAAAVELFKENN